ncbi:cell surface glycoprotein CD200 receptor 5-like isoform X1 [Arapaima gigas]
MSLCKQPAVGMFLTWIIQCVFWLQLWIFTHGQQIAMGLPEGKQVMKSSLIDYRHEVLSVGGPVDMECANMTKSKLIYSLWKLHMRGRMCNLTTEYLTRHYENTCEDGKVLIRGISRESYLHIPQFTLTDEGIYVCETAYWGGSYMAEIVVSARVRPQITSELKVIHGRRVAVCLAVGGKPAASISWSTMGNFTGNQSHTLNADGTVTVKSYLVLPENISSEVLNCIVTHPSFREAEKVSPLGLEGGVVPVITVQYSILSFCSIVLLFAVVASFCILRKSVLKCLNTRCFVDSAH